jgi:hypothetical protein
MPTDKKYLLDANVFIEAKRRYYAFDVCPGFWECLVWHHQGAFVHSIDRVKEEIERGGDELKEWVQATMPASCFASCDDVEVIEQYSQMQLWAHQQGQFTESAKAEFAGKADAWLIAYAKAKHFVLVTHEVLDRQIQKKIPMPNVCEAFDVPYVDTFTMLRDLEAQFNWRQPNT